MTVVRSLQPAVLADLPRKMVFVVGPRQVGKTTLGRQCLDLVPGVYLNWDNRDDRRELRAPRWPGGRALVVLDELHKSRSWKSWLKGEYDTHHPRLQFLVTGSARLDTYRRGGDSLQGRYHAYRLHPFSVAELVSPGVIPDVAPGRELILPPPTKTAAAHLAALFEFGGFPEPLLAQSARTLRRWQRDRIDRFFREDVRDLESIRDLSLVEQLADAIPEHVGSLLSLNALREDLEVSHRAVTHWIGVLERLYHVVLLRPFVSRRITALKKMPKAYLWDWSLVTDPAGRFENMLALHLLKFCHMLRDRDGYDVELWYLRDRAGHEVDFLVTLDRKPWFAAEAKLAETAIDPALRYFRDRLRVPWVYQVVKDCTRDVVDDGVRCVPASTFLAALA
ncbi:MAG: ATP-binding protein [Acidobacteria bacterium]|nr:ATP-binding protein [Acidobacteriota bacterium]